MVIFHSYVKLPEGIYNVQNTTLILPVGLTGWPFKLWQAIGMMPPAQPARAWRCRQRGDDGVIEAGHGGMVGWFMMVYDGCHVLVLFFRTILGNGSKMRDQNLEIDISPGIWTDWHKELLILCVGLVPHYRAIPNWQTNCQLLPGIHVFLILCLDPRLSKNP